jgi:hypothetical protein
VEKYLKMKTKTKKQRSFAKYTRGGGPGARGPQDKAGKTQFIILSKTKSKKKEQQTNRKKRGAARGGCLAACPPA